MGLLEVLTKQGRWTKGLPEAQRAKADAILALKNFDKMQKDIAAGRLAPTDPSVLAREMRVNELTEAIGMDDYIPRVGGGKPNKRTGLTQLEELLGVGSPELRKFRKPRGAPFSGKIPGPPPGGYPPEGFKKFLADLAMKAKELRAFAAAKRKPLMYAGAGAGAVGLGLLGLHAATQKRNKELRGKG
jgi:hypothetical protein